MDRSSTRLDHEWVPFKLSTLFSSKFLRLASSRRSRSSGMTALSSVANKKSIWLTIGEEVDTFSYRVRARE